MLKSKKAKIALFSSLGVLVAGLAVAGYFMSQGSSTSPDGVYEEPLTYTIVSEGSIASATLLTGTVSAAEEQYVYYDSSKGDLTGLLVAQGDQVQVGTPLVQYDTSELQSNLDSAVRARDKVGRQIYDLKTNGQTVDLTGDAATDSQATSSAQRSVDMQLQDLNDAYADAQAAVDKAYQAVTEATVNSTVAGTVVEVNQSVSKSSTTSQTLVHIVNQSSLQVKGSLTEYDLANLAVDQEVRIRTKVYPDKEWTGKITYISNYPEGNQAADATSGTGTGGAKYPFKAAITSDMAELKQGFTVNIEVVNTSSSILVPTSALVYGDDGTYVWTIVDGKAKKVAVELGNADALNQEVTAGLTVGDQVISNPNNTLEEGKEVEAYDQTVN
ncbi:TPA: efflux RND transporter periplasmic adaptor subunit [Streptococcus suis]|nr:efflux RND transporter periplasmic adaptor subunit [Streptococcus suis]